MKQMSARQARRIDAGSEGSRIDPPRVLSEEVAHAAGIDFVHRALRSIANWTRSCPRSRRWAQRSPSSISTATAGPTST